MCSTSASRSTDVVSDDTKVAISLALVVGLVAVILSASVWMR